jgi:hypothetical protein
MKSSTTTSSPEPKPTVMPVMATPSANLVKLHIDNDYFAIVAFMDWYSDDVLYSIIPEKTTYVIDYLYIDLQNHSERTIPIFAPGLSDDEIGYINTYFHSNAEQIYMASDKNQFVIFVNIPDYEKSIWPWHNYEIWKYDKSIDQFTVLIDKDSDFQSNYRITIEIDPNSVIIDEKEKAFFIYHNKYPYHSFINLETGEYLYFEADWRCSPYDRPIFSGNGEKIIIGDGIFRRDDYFSFLERCESLIGNIEQEEELIELLYNDFKNKYAIADISSDLIRSDNLFEMNDAGNHYYYNDIDSGKSENKNVGNIVRVNIQTGETLIVVPEDVIQNNGLDVDELSIRVSPDEDRILLIPERYGKDVYIYSLNK